MKTRRPSLQLQDNWNLLCVYLLSHTIPYPWNISEAHARMRYSNIVERIDVAEAIRLVKAALQQAAIDPRTGTIDMDLITTGRSATARSRLADLTKEVRSLVMQRGESGMPWTLESLHKKIADQSDIVRAIMKLKLNVQTVTNAEVREALKALEGEDFIALTGEDRNPMVRMI